MDKNVVSALGISFEWPVEEDFDNDKTAENIINPFARAEYKVWTSDPAWGMTGWKEDRFKWGLGRFMKNQALEMCLARAEREVIGFSIGYEVSREQFREVSFSTPLDYEMLFAQEEEIFWISDVGVIPAWQGRGLGKLVVGRLLERVESEHPEIATVVLRTREDEPRAIALYRGLGFAQILGIHDAHYANRIYFWLRLQR